MRSADTGDTPGAIEAGESIRDRKGLQAWIPPCLTSKTRIGWPAGPLEVRHDHGHPLIQGPTVSVTVLLELEWVLRGFYELPRASIHRALSALCTYGNVVVEDRARVLAALQAFEQGLDFADALHLSRAASCTALLTFDKRFIKRASSLPDAIPCEQPRSS